MHSLNEYFVKRDKPLKYSVLTYFEIEDYEDVILACKTIEEIGLLYLEMTKDKVFSYWLDNIEARAVDMFFNEVAIRLKKFDK